MERNCPHCYSGKLFRDSGTLRRIGAMVYELVNPLEIPMRLITPLIRNYAQGMPTVRKDYYCDSCERQAYECARCNTYSRLSKKPGQGDVINCSNCGKDSVFRLD